jgi:FMN phosphatase YigB (HAD superfamily)
MHEETVDNDGHPRSFFISVLQQLGIKVPQEALLIDDSPEKVTMAQHYGLQAVQFENHQQLQETLEEGGVLQ